MKIEKIFTTAMTTGFVLAFATLPSWSVDAKIKNFNEIIEQNVNDQKALHKAVRKQLKTARATDAGVDLDRRERYVITEPQSQPINSPTSKTALKFNKESKQYKASDKEPVDRIATELDDSTSVNP